jgi:density-regulated protein DRP1
LENFNYELKKIAKDFGKKFACGSSVTKIPGGGEEITVQGDVAYDIEEWMMDNMKEIPEDNIEVIEEKKKKGSAGPSAAG